MESTYRTSQVKVNYVRGEHAFCLCGHKDIHLWSNTQYKESLKPSSVMKSSGLRDNDNTGVKKVKSSTDYLLSRWPRNTDLMHIGKFMASNRNAAGHKYEVEEQKFTAEKEQERKLKQYKPSKVQPFISEQDAQSEKKQQDAEKYLDTALQDILTWPDGCFIMRSRNDITSAKNSRYEENDSNYLCNFDSNCNKSVSGGIITNQSTTLSQECTDNVACVPDICHESDLSIDNASLDCQYTSSACTNSLQRYTDTNNTKSAECDSSEKLVISGHFESHVESCQSDSFKKRLTETSMFESSEEAVYVTPKVVSHCDKEMESSTFRYTLSNGQRQPEMQSEISYPQSDVSGKSHDLAFFKTTNSNILLKSKVTFDDSMFEKGHKTGRFKMATTELGVHEKPHFLRPEVICERKQRQINVQSRVYYWHQVMQLYFTLATALSVGGSLNWLFQLRPVTLQALQRLQSILNYPFTSLNEFFNSESRESPPSAEERMSVEWMRLQTFLNYPVTAHGSPIRLAREGFFYTGQGTQTRCFSCGVSHGEWNFLDNPHEVHQRLSPNCPFLNGRQEGYRNIPMSPDESRGVGRADRDSIPPPSLPFAPLPGSGTGQGQAEGNRSVSTEVPQTSKTTDEDDKILPQQNLESGETTLSVHSHPVEESAQSEADNRPKFPEHIPLPSRIATFSHGWPPYLDQTPQQMAEAGFFFTGNQDYTRCYQCGGGLRNWEPGDNPWIEHCRWYPTCPHIQKGKGQRFVNAVLKKQAELLATQRAECRRKAQYGIGSTDPLETLAAITLLEMGYPRDTVRNSILILRRQKEPAAEITALEVLDFIWKEEDIERQRQEEEASRPRRPGDAQPPALPTLMERLNLGGSPAVTQAAVQQSASITTSTSSITTAVITTTSATLAISSASGTSSTTSVSTSTSASGATQSTNATSQGQGKDQGKGQNTSVGGHGNTRGKSMQRNGVAKGSVGGEIAAQNHEESKQGEQRPSGAVGGRSEGPGARAQAVAAIIDEDEEFHSLDPEEMENRDYGELEEENKRLKEQTTCKICMENPISVIFLPCGHLVCCEPCAPAFRKCPICRKRIQQSVKTFL